MIYNDITFLIPSMRGGGAEKVTMLLANELKNRGWKVTILLAKQEGPYIERLNKDIKIVLLKKQSISKNLLEISSYLQEKKPAIFYSSMMYVNTIAGLAARIAKYKGKLIFSEHSHVSSVLSIHRNLTTKIIFKLAKWLYKDAYTVICVSEGVQKDLISKIKNINTIVINNPVESLFQIKSKNKNDKFRIISMGRLDRDKNFQLLIKAFSEVLRTVKDKEYYELNILGEGYERTNLEQLIITLGLQDKVFLHGFVDNPSEMLQSSDLFVFTSVREGFGNVLVEALSCGLPVISTDCPSGPAEILMNGKIGTLVPINNKTALVESILESIVNPDKYSTQEQRINRAKDFSIKNIVNKYENLFLTV